MSESHISQILQCLVEVNCGHEDVQTECITLSLAHYALLARAVINNHYVQGLGACEKPLDPL